MINAALLERAHALRSLRDANSALQHANSELESFSYSLSHDLRSPVRTVTSYSQIMLDDAGEKLNEEEKEHLRRIVRAGKHMAQVIEDVVSLSFLLTRELKREPIDLSQLAHSIVKQIKEQHPDRRVAVDIQDDIDVVADKGLMRLALHNLFENAWKYTRDAKEPHIRFGTTLGDGKKWIYVRDNGAGFDMKYADMLFRPFQRLHSPSEYGGTGIGLATVKRALDRHGGEIRAEASVGAGATFYFVLP